MQQTILLNATENTKQVEREEQGYFVHSLLSAFVGAPIDEIWTEPELSMEQHTQLRKLLTVYGIEVLNDNDGGVKIYCWNKTDNKHELIGEFRKPHYVLKKDPGQVDPNKKQYLEMTINTWSSLEKDE